MPQVKVGFLLNDSPWFFGFCCLLVVVGVFVVDTVVVIVESESFSEHGAY